jgi:hypothetical protein
MTENNYQFICRECKYINKIYLVKHPDATELLVQRCKTLNTTAI